MNKNIKKQTHMFGNLWYTLNVYLITHLFDLLRKDKDLFPFEHASFLSVP